MLVYALKSDGLLLEFCKRGCLVLITYIFMNALLFMFTNCSTLIDYTAIGVKVCRSSDGEQKMKSVKKM